MRTGSFWKSAHLRTEIEHFDETSPWDQRNSHILMPAREEFSDYDSERQTTAEMGRS